MEFELPIEKDPEALLKIAVAGVGELSMPKEINLLKQLISLSDLQESFEDCDEFNVSVSRFYLLENGEVCIKFGDLLDETPNIAVYRNGEVFYCYGQGHEEHVLTLHAEEGNIK